MVQSRLTNVISEAAFLSHDSVRTGSQYNRASQLLLPQDLAKFIRYHIGAGYIHIERKPEFLIRDTACILGRHENSGRHYQIINSPVCEHRLLKKIARLVPARDI